MFISKFNSINNYYVRVYNGLSFNSLGSMFKTLVINYYMENL